MCFLYSPQSNQLLKLRLSNVENEIYSSFYSRKNYYYFYVRLYMKIIVGLFIFCVVLFIYLHVQFHLKTSNDLEMYEMLEEEESKNKLEETCDVRQPVMFNFDNESIMETTNQEYIYKNYHAFEVKIRNTTEKEENTELYMPLPLHAAIKLFQEDKNSCYISENNGEFLQETGVIKNMSYNDAFLRPYMVSNCNYDILMGSGGASTPFRYEINYRNYFLLTQGKAQIKLSPPQSTRYLHPNYDYENFEFRSPLNPWNIQPSYVADFDKIKCLEFTLTPGKTLFIPSYWWYSIQFENNTSISCFRYRTYMNNLAISPYIAMHALQIQNIKRNTNKKIDIQELNGKNESVSCKNDSNLEEIEQETQVAEIQPKTETDDTSLTSSSIDSLNIPSAS